MRLGQLARKLAIRPSEIVVFLSSKGIGIEENSNTRLDDNLVGLVIQHFDPQGKTVIIEAEPVAPQPSSELPEEIKEEKIELPFAEEPVVTSFEENEPTPAEKTEVIKAQRVELSGLKVVGKIDLPEPKKKVAEPKVENSDNDEVQRPRVRKERREQKQGWKNPIAAEREREAREAEQKRQARAAEDKERRTRNYQNRVKASVPTKRVKLVDEPVTELVTVEAPPAKTLVGRFLRWLKS